MKFDRFLAVMIMLIFVSMAYAIIITASAHVTYKPRLPTWEPPEIAQCDMPLWDRIRNVSPMQQEEIGSRREAEVDAYRPDPNGC